MKMEAEVGVMPPALLPGNVTSSGPRKLPALDSLFDLRLHYKLSPVPASLFLERYQTILNPHTTPPINTCLM